MVENSSTVDGTGFTKTDYKRFLPLASVLNDIGRLDKNQTVQETYFHDGLLKAVENTLASLGFRRVSGHVQSGSAALVFEAGDHQMLRIVSENINEPARLDDPSVLQPLMTMRCGNKESSFLIELLPKVHTLFDALYDDDLTQYYHLKDGDKSRFAKELNTHLLHLNNPHVFFDMGSRNIALMKDKQGNTVPVILDPGAIAELSKLDEPIYKDELITVRDTLTQNSMQFIFEFTTAMMDAHFGNQKIWMDNFLDELLHTPPPRYNFQEAQDCHLERLGLIKGKAKNVVSDNVIAEYRAKPKHTDATAACVEMAKEDGLTDQEIRDVLADAKRNPVGKNFGDAVMKARNKYVSAMPGMVLR